MFTDSGYRKWRIDLGRAIFSLQVGTLNLHVLFCEMPALLSTFLLGGLSFLIDFWIQILCLVDVLQILLSLCGLPFHSLIVSSSYFNVAQFISLSTRLINRFREAQWLSQDVYLIKGKCFYSTLCPCYQSSLMEKWDFRSIKPECISKCFLWHFKIFMF